MCAGSVTLPGITFKQGELYKIAPGELIFQDRTFQWHEPPQIGNGVALRTGLNLDVPVAVKVDSPGILYAVFWQWDFGFLQHGYSTIAERVHGWQRISLAGGSPRHQSGISTINWFLNSRLDPRPHAAPSPFSPLQLYSRRMAAGEHALPLTEYHGQWVIVGFLPDPEFGIASPDFVPVTLSPAKTRHNICNPGAALSVQTDKVVRVLRIFHHGKLVLRSETPEFTAPQAPGRYCVEIAFHKPDPNDEYGPNPYAKRLLPLTVSHPPVTDPGWSPDFFPILFWEGWDYRGHFKPNPDLTENLSILNQFEIGANITYCPVGGHELLEALNMRLIVGVRAKTKFQLREVEEEDFRPGSFLWEIEHHGPFSPNVFGFHIEDEPPSWTATRFKKCLEEFQGYDSKRHLIYCLHGAHAPDFWKIATPTIRQTRAYPIRRVVEDNYLPQITTEMADYLIACQQADATTPLWFVLQSFGDLGRPGGIDRWNQPTPEQLRLMINLALGRGVKAFSYFCFGGSPAAREDLSAIVRYPYVPYDGLYDEVIRLNRYISQNARFLNGLVWQQTFNQPNKQLDVQILTDAEKQHFAYVTNFGYKEAATTTLSFPKWNLNQTIHLEPGDAEIINLSNP